MKQAKGRNLKKKISCLNDITQLPVPDPEQSLTYVMNAIRLTKQELDGKVPLIGFSGSPWTLATYMVEGGSSRTFTKIKKMLYCEPKALHLLLEKLANSVALYLNAQIAAGAQSIMIFDTWGGALSHQSYRSFSLHYMQLIISQLKRGKKSQNITSYIPVTLFTKGGGLWLDAISNSGGDAIGVDWTVDLNQIDQKGNISIQGNLDPAILYANQETIASNVESVLAEFGHYNGHIFNLGHGIHQDIPIEHVQYLVDAVHKQSKRFHS